MQCQVHYTQHHTINEIAYIFMSATLISGQCYLSIWIIKATWYKHDYNKINEAKACSLHSNHEKVILFEL